MGETIELTDVVLRVIGAFYAFGGFVATRAGLMSQFLDRAIAAIALKKPPRSETAQNAWLIATAALVLIGGVLLLAGLQLAAWVFVASCLGQAAYIYYVAPRFFDGENEPDGDGRRGSTNAFVIYSAATAFILWAAYRGRLLTLDEASTPALIAVGAALLLYAGYVARALWWSPRKRGASAGGLLGAMPDDKPGLPPHEVEAHQGDGRLRLRSAVGAGRGALRLLCPGDDRPVARADCRPQRLGGGLRHVIQCRRSRKR